MRCKRVLDRCDVRRAAASPTPRHNASLAFKTCEEAFPRMRRHGDATAHNSDAMSILRLPAKENFVPLGDATRRHDHLSDIDMRVPRLVWACGESFDKPQLSVASELLRYGFKEWAGIRELRSLRGVTAQGWLTREGVDELCELAQPRTDIADCPIMLCRDVHAPARIIERSAEKGRVSLAYLGAPEDPEERLRRWPFRPAIPPIPMPDGLTPDSLIWLGVSPECEPQRQFGRDAGAQHLSWLTAHLARTTPLALWLVIRVDKLRLGRPGPGHLDERVVAAVMRYRQACFLEGGIILLCEGPATPASPHRLGEAAQAIGRALHRVTRR